MDNNHTNLDIEFLSLCAEAALFASGSSVDFDHLAEAIGTEKKNILPVLNHLKTIYMQRTTAISLHIFEDSAVFATKKEYAETVKTALNLRKNQPLSKAALEVLAIIAYNQPTTRAFVDKVRGVESPSVVSSLCEKGLIEEKGRLEAPGRPVLFGTTPVFLRTFGLTSVAELSEIPEIAEYLAQLKAQNQIELEQAGDQPEYQEELLSDETSKNNEAVDTDIKSED